MTEALGSTATPESGRPENEADEALDARAKKKRGGKRGKKGPFARIGLFYRQIIAELRKVVWPARNDLMSYTTVVIVFVAVMIGIVTVVDWGFSSLLKYVFG
ncbi:MULTISPECIES: preprotein translocase subunit SecE [Streptomycetaceae]|uniref:preprotein translocase subunit SecE n=1 Tax=Streptomycetaceae TaxID=2062 RepID=UPI000213D310|nr:preprotein translocase subunit SecE [Streptantibioticus cattleyicolor]MYS60456.1 preprotein translocase subunit SecE [Streptomyces sp. SID5468]CCB76255.1 Preprotein translocase subunit secE [Streptantibioticus cattleyicolor NRRL 8057 = DSM 46488]